MDKILATHSQKYILDAMRKAQWWELVQDEVKERLLLLVDNIEHLGVRFKDAYYSLFKFVHMRRLLDGVSERSSKQSPLFPLMMSEETYQASIPCVKTLLDLNDWVKPNDADVQACMFLVRQIEVMEIIDDKFKETDIENLKKRPPP